MLPTLQQRRSIAANETINPKDEWWHNFSINKIKFRISNYLQNRSNLEAFVNKAQAYRVEVNLYDFASKETLWYDCGGLNTPRENDDRIVAERFNKCAFRGCLTLEAGELHRCSRAPNAGRMQGFNNLPPPTDFVMVRNNKHLAENLVGYISYPHFETACRYCNGTFNTKKILAAEQL